MDTPECSSAAETGLSAKARRVQRRAILAGFVWTATGICISCILLGGFVGSPIGYLALAVAALPLALLPALFASARASWNAHGSSVSDAPMPLRLLLGMPPEGRLSFRERLAWYLPAERASSKVQLLLLVLFLSGWLLFAIVFHERPAGAMMRPWLANTLLVSLACLAASLVLALFNLNTGPLRRVKLWPIRMLLRIVSVAATLVALFCLLVVAAFDIPQPPFSSVDGVQIERQKDGSYRIAVTPYLDKTETWRFVDGGPFYLLNGACVDNGRHPIAAEPDAPAASASGPEETADAPSVSAPDPEETAHKQRIDAGYDAILSRYFHASLAVLPERASAKGMPEPIVEDTDGHILWLAYNRDAADGTCGIYVLLKAQKAADGAYSPSDASIEDRYAYDYETGETAQADSHGWSDAGNEAFRRLTGE